ncbi:MAG: hypothetical protein AAGD14_01720 [Planctomycetota bacterium]
MTGGRVVVVHTTGSVRAHLGELLTREGYSVESLDSTYRCMARVVDDPADLVVVGLAGLAESELELIPALREESEPPRILVTFPPSLREVASDALTRGADAYLLEPFYGSELVRLTASLLQNGAAPPATPETITDPEPLRKLAREVAHAVNNPLQVARLLLEKKNVTKKELEEGVPEQLARVEDVVGRLRTFGATESGPRSRADLNDLARAAAAEVGIELTAEGRAPVLVDEAMARAALEALFATVKERVEDCKAEASNGHVRLAVDATAFEDDDIRTLTDAVFVVDPQRGLRAGLALPRWLLEEQGGSLAIDTEGAALVFRASLPLG